ncbi:MAG: response regulator transcription factor, partial [Spirochaetia bacterium]|nr:response regulator transcription factor [Spirochaetia bacterium]
MAKIYIVEDNDAISEAVKGYLELNEHEVSRFAKLEGVIDSIRSKQPDLIIIDIMLPDGSGFNLAKQIRKKHDIPFIFLTARDQESDRITGFEIGADDYVVKPFSPRELVLRVEAVLKRTRMTDRLSSGGRKGKSQWTLDGMTLEIDEESHTIRENSLAVDLTAAEWKIIDYLAGNEGILLSREKILGECLDYFYEGSERTVDT